MKWIEHTCDKLPEHGALCLLDFEDEMEDAGWRWEEEAMNGGRDGLKPDEYWVGTYRYHIGTYNKYGKEFRIKIGMCDGHGMVALIDRSEITRYMLL